MSLSLEKMHYGFAIEELLGSGARVIQEKVFSTKHIGRVFDFILFEGQDFLANCANRETTEYRIRNLMDQLVFCGFSQHKKDEKLKFVEMDCGWDQKKFILSVSFLIDKEMRDFNPSVETQSPKELVLKKTIEDLQNKSDGVVVRVQREYSKLQIFCFIEGEEASSEENAQTESEKTVNLIVLKKPEHHSEVPAPFETAVETDANAVSNAPLPSASPSTLAEAGLKEFEHSEKKNELETKQKAIAGAKKVENLDEVKSKLREKIAVDKLEETIDDNMRINSEGEVQGSISLLLDTLKSEIMPLCIGLSKEQFDLAFAELTEKIQENYSQTIHHLVKLKTIQMVSKVNHYKDQMKVMQGKIDEFKAEREEMIEKIGQNDLATAELLKLRSKMESDKEAKEKVEKIERETVVLTKKLEKQADQMQLSEPAKDWAKEFTKAAEKERTIFQNKLREKEAEIKKKEIEATSKENGLKEKLRLAEEKYKQQEFTVKKVKESLSTTLGQLERSKTGSSGKVESVDELKAKLGATEKLLIGAKDNIERMQKRVDEVQHKWQEEFTTRSSLQKEFSDAQKKIKELEKKNLEMKSQSQSESGSASASESSKLHVEGLRLEKERLGKVLEDMKSKNNELQRKVDSLTNQLAHATSVSGASKQGFAASSEAKKVGAQSDAEMKLKYDRLQKLQASTKDELEKIRKKFDETRQEEIRLKAEVLKLQSELKLAAKNGPSKSSPTTTKGGLMVSKKPTPVKK